MFGEISLEMVKAEDQSAMHILLHNYEKVVNRLIWTFLNYLEPKLLNFGGISSYWELSLLEWHRRWKK